MWTKLRIRSPEHLGAGTFLHHETVAVPDDTVSHDVYDLYQFETNAFPGKPAILLDGVNIEILCHRDILTLDRFKTTTERIVPEFFCKARG